MAPRTHRPIRQALALLPLLALAACGGGDSPASPDAGGGGDREPPPPGPGPWLSVTPIPLERVVRITPLGHNNNVIPTGHTYWDVCDIWSLLPSGECNRERLPIQAPMDGVVADVDPQDDGTVVLEGPPRLYVRFGHVTARPGLQRGDSVQAGDTVATMYFDHGFDFGVIHFGLEPHPFIRPERTPLSYRYSQSPIAQYPEPLRSQLVARVQTFADPLGELSFDLAGTAQGNWFREGTPLEEAFSPANEPGHLFMGPLQERRELRILSVGEAWEGSFRGLTVIDPAAPDWKDITPSTGPIALTAWNLGSDAAPNYVFPRGTWLLEMLSETRLRLEWFEGHQEPAGFTAAARIYER